MQARKVELTVDRKLGRKQSGAERASVDNERGAFAFSKLVVTENVRSSDGEGFVFTTRACSSVNNNLTTCQQDEYTEQNDTHLAFE